MQDSLPPAKRAKIAPATFFAPIKSEPNMPPLVDLTCDFLFEPVIKQDPVLAEQDPEPESGAQLSVLSAPAPVPVPVPFAGQDSSVSSNAACTLELGPNLLLFEDMGCKIMGVVWKASLVDSIALSRVSRFFHQVYRKLFLDETVANDVYRDILPNEDTAFLNKGKRLTYYQVNFVRQIQLREETNRAGWFAKAPLVPQEVLDRHADKRVCFGNLVSDAGSGKTVIWIRYIMSQLVLGGEKSRDEKTLIIMPLALLDQWLNAFKEYASETMEEHGIFVESFHLKQGTVRGLGKHHSQPLSGRQRLDRASVIIIANNSSSRLQGELAHYTWSRILVDEIKNSGERFSDMYAALQDAGKTVWYFSASDLLQDKGYRRKLASYLGRSAFEADFQAALGLNRGREWTKTWSEFIRQHTLCIHIPNAVQANFRVPKAARETVYLEPEMFPERWSTPTGLSIQVSRIMRDSLWYNDRRRCSSVLRALNNLSASVLGAGWKEPETAFFADLNASEHNISSTSIDCGRNGFGAIRWLFEHMNARMQPGDGALVFMPAHASGLRKYEKILDLAGFHCHIANGRGGAALSDFMNDKTRPNCRRVIMFVGTSYLYGLEFQKFANHVYWIGEERANDEIWTQVVGRIERPGQPKKEVFATEVVASPRFWPAGKEEEMRDELRRGIRARICERLEKMCQCIVLESQFARVCKAFCITNPENFIRVDTRGIRCYVFPQGFITQKVESLPLEYWDCPRV